MKSEKQTWWYAVITHKKDFPFTTHMSLDKEQIISCASLFGDDYELRSIELEKP